MSKFVTDYLSGHATLDAIDDYVDRWHAQSSGSEDLPTFLGLSQQEYSRWVREPDTLSQILKSKSSSHPMWDVLLKETTILDALIAKLDENQIRQHGSVDSESLPVSILMTQALGVSLHSILKITQDKDLSIRDAYGISRSISELAVNICYIAATGKSTAERAQQHALQKQFRSFDRSAEIGGIKIDLHRSVVLPSGDVANLNTALSEFTSKSGREIGEWADKNISGRIGEIGAVNQRVAIALAASIFTVYRDASELLHGTYSGVLHFWSAHGAVARNRESFYRVWDEHFMTVFTSSYFASQAVVSFFSDALDLQEIRDAQSNLTAEIKRFSDRERISS